VGSAGSQDGELHAISMAKNGETEKDKTPQKRTWKMLFGPVQLLLYGNSMVKFSIP
jgi:hypothetical protein